MPRLRLGVRALALLFALPLAACATIGGSPGRFYALRLRPGQDLRRELHAFAKDHRLRAAAIVSCVGSLKQVQLRLANQPGSVRIDGPHEIVSLVGTVTQQATHLHMAISDPAGRTVGGHLLEDSLVYTTAELVLVELQALTFTRLPDPATGYDELTISPR